MLTAQRSRVSVPGEEWRRWKWPRLAKSRAAISNTLRLFQLPPTVGMEDCDARLQDGVLHITLNKREETKPRKIQVG